MKHVYPIIFIFLVLGILGQIRFLEENILVGNELETHVNIVNRERTDIDNLRVKMFIPDLGIVISGNPVDIEGREKQGRFLFWDADVKQGEYLVRIIASSDKTKDVKYRYITVR